MLPFFSLACVRDSIRRRRKRNNSKVQKYHKNASFFAFIAFIVGLDSCYERHYRDDCGGHGSSFPLSRAAVVEKSRDQRPLAYTKLGSAEFGERGEKLAEYE